MAMRRSFWKPLVTRGEERLEVLYSLLKELLGAGNGT